jgi:hypothetical protein
MEYLMTYGWALLIMVIVLIALYEFGVFNANTFAPRAQPGGCYVEKSQGPGYATIKSLAGTCNPALPLYAPISSAQEAGCVAGNVLIEANIMSVSSLSALTITYWGEEQYPHYGSSMLHLESANTAPGGNGVYCGGMNCDFPDNSFYSPAPTVIYGRYYFSAITLDSSGNANLYYNGELNATKTWGGPLTGITNFYIFGYSPECNDNVNGSVMNVQVYNTALSQNDIKALYEEGIGGVPQNLNNLIAWWPLNGNAKDYSGNGFNGNIMSPSIVFSTSWSGYYT